MVGLELVKAQVRQADLLSRVVDDGSSVTQSLYRTLHQLSGKITIDDVDISTIGLQDLRSVMSSKRIPLVLHWVEGLP